jgi:hypothetical protein
MKESNLTVYLGVFVLLVSALNLFDAVTYGRVFPFFV